MQNKVYKDMRPPLKQELGVTFSSRHYDVHPDPHGLRRRCYHVEDSVPGFHTEGKQRFGALGRETAHVQSNAIV